MRLAIIAVAIVVLGTGCSGIRTSGSVSPATFLLPGLGQVQPAPAGPAVPSSPPEAVQTLARSH